MVFHNSLRIILLLSSLFYWLTASPLHKELFYLNDIRKNAGMIKLKHNSSLQESSSLHAKYLVKNQEYGHYETRGKNSYTGTTPRDRVLKSGYSSGYIMENVSVNKGGYTQSIDNLFSAIYHRFVFLDFDKDEIGIGNYTTKNNVRIQAAYVYSLGSKGIANLCLENFTMFSGKYYMKDICKDSEKMVPQDLFEKQKNYIREKNKSIVVYPYPAQKDIWPAFYNESPDPLPDHKVSGFPISVQFNPLYYKNIILETFRLYDAKGDEIKSTKILQYTNDHNKLFKKTEFALMPLKRLDFSAEYTAVFKATANGKEIHKRWKFNTVELKEKVFTIINNRTDIIVQEDEAIVLYIVPRSRNNIINSYTYKGKLNVTFLDQNTLMVKVFSKNSSLDFGRRKIHFNIK